LNAAFDLRAASYDEEFTGTSIGRLMRQAVWRRCDVRFQPGSRVLEMNCGTGEDAVHLGKRGVRVFATDSATHMVEIAALKIAQAEVGNVVTVAQLAWEQLDRLDEGLFDGALSNFGGLNCVAHIEAIKEPLARCLRPGATALLCVMGPLTPWEWIWYLLRKQPAKAFRRLKQDGTMWSGVRVRYPSIRALRRALAPEFRAVRISAIGAIVPPPYAEPWARRHPKLLRRLNRWERRMETVPPLPWLADHYLLELERVAVGANGPERVKARKRVGPTGE
jgi:ubiquinone/menaquinone biosynthesis C-methylase UbiE